MSDSAISFGMWWLANRKKVDQHFLLVGGIVGVVSGGILLFSGLHVVKAPFLVHALEFIFTFSINALLVFGLTKNVIEDNLDSLLALPALVSVLSYSFFVVLVRVVPHFNSLTPWIVTFENALLQKTWMEGGPWIGITILGGFAILVLTFWAISRARFLDLLWPFLTYFLTAMVINLVTNFFIFLACYSTKIVTY